MCSAELYLIPDTTRKPLGRVLIRTYLDQGGPVGISIGDYLDCYCYRKAQPTVGSTFLRLGPELY